jgi:hypothetical protein
MVESNPTLVAEATANNANLTIKTTAAFSPMAILPTSPSRPNSHKLTSSDF